jgi:dephospho-CoA kinase
VLGADGSLDRSALAEIVFADPDQLAALNAIVHPHVARRSADIMAAAPAGAIVVYDVPLLVENQLADQYDVVVVVEAPLDVRLRRLAEHRGMSEADARSRIAAQATDDVRRASAHEVLVNDGGREALAEAVDGLWQRLQQGCRTSDVP